MNPLGMTKRKKTTLVAGEEVGPVLRRKDCQMSPRTHKVLKPTFRLVAGKVGERVVCATVHTVTV
jgi:hypothetical protein